jgi:hypothetical protein
MIALGISMRRAALGLPAETVWATYAVWVVPLTLVAALGEAMWIGVVMRAARVADRPDGMRGAE